MKGETHAVPARCRARGAGRHATHGLRVGLLALSLLVLRAPAGAAQTVAMWLFDEQRGLYPSSVIHDVGPAEHVLVLGRSGRIVEGRFGNALEIGDPSPLDLTGIRENPRFGLVEQGGPANGAAAAMTWSNAHFAALMTSGESHLRKDVGFSRPTTTGLNLGAFDWTVEFWFHPAPELAGEGVVFELGTGPRGSGAPLTRLSAHPAEGRFTLRNGDALLEIPSDARALRAAAGRWSHFAFVYSAAAGELRHFVNGRLQRGSPRAVLRTLPEGDEDYFSIGRDGLWRRPLLGRIDELRFSRGALYRRGFRPPRSFAEHYLPEPGTPRLQQGPPLLFAGDASRESVVRLGARKHLFLDDALVAEAEGIAFAVNPPRIDPCVLEVDGAFRKHMTVLEDEAGLIRLYAGMDDDYLGVLVSRDGIHFEAPDVAPEYRGRRNLVIQEPTAMGTVLLDPNAPAEQRWKYISDYHRRGVYVYTSADGYRFERQKQAALPFRSGSQNDVFYDDQRQVYVGLHRTDAPRTPAGHTQREFVRTEVTSLLGPWPFTPISRERWREIERTKPLEAMVPYYLDNGPLTPANFGLDYPLAFGPDAELDPVTAGVYNPKAMKYPWAPDTYLAFPVMYFTYYEGYPGQRALAERYGGGPVETQFAVSRDGIHWRRYPRPTYVGIGRFGELDVVQSFIAQGMVRRGEEIWQYVFADADYHTAIPGSRTHRRCVSRLVQRFDGFVSAEAPYEREGTLRTRPLVFDGERLVLNIDTDAHGYAMVGLLDERGAPIPGYEAERSVLVNGDFIEHEVEWLDHGSDLSALAGRTVQVVFRLRGAKLYSMQFRR